MVSSLSQHLHHHNISYHRSLFPLLFICTIFILFSIIFIQNEVFSSNGLISKRSIDMPDGHPNARRPFKKRWVHLDMKGAPPRLSYLYRLFPILNQLGVSGLLIEWEDSFPFEGRLNILKSSHSYSKSDVLSIIKKANESSLEVIPLIQSFGHLEYVLKHDRFAHLRERVTEENSICPSRNESIPLIRDIIRQIRTLHSDSTRLHIGADEAYYVGEDVHCRKRLLSEFKENVERLKLDHIARVARVGMEEGFDEILAWNDMFDKVDIELMNECGLGRLITPVVWGYAVDVTKDGYFPQGLFNRLAHVFPRVWFASAYKGANGASNPFISIDRYLVNQQSYLKLYKQNAQDMSDRLEGIILTGWSRFSHRQPLCELLPISLPSLVVNLQYLNDVLAPPRDITARTKNILACPSTSSRSLYEPKRVNQSIFYPSREEMFTLCVFPASDLFTAVQELRFLDWKSKRLSADNEIERLKFNDELIEMEGKLRPLLSSVIFEDAVNEFIRYHVQSLFILPPTPSPPTSFVQSYD